MLIVTFCSSLHCQATNSAFHNSVKPLLQKSILKASPVSLFFASNLAEAEDKVSADLLTVLSDMSPSSSAFDVDVYMKNLKSKVLGNVLMYIEVVPTTMTLFERWELVLNNPLRFDHFSMPCLTLLFKQAISFWECNFVEYKYRDFKHIGIFT